MRLLLRKTGVFLSGLMMMGLVTTGSAQAITFTTAQNQFDTGVDNRGWWSPVAINGDDNDNYATGSKAQRRSFFTFDLSSLIGTATSATLKIIRAVEGSINEALETLEFFDVSTSAATLNNNVGTSQAIFDDLGTGASYGAFAVAGSGAPTEVLSFVLNAQALTEY